MYAGLARSKNVGGSGKLFGTALGIDATLTSREMVMENGNGCWPTTLRSHSDTGVHMGSVMSRKGFSSCLTAMVTE